MVEGGPPPDREDPLIREDHDYDVTFAVRIECTACGHLMLFSSQKFRTEYEPILVRDRAEEQDQLRE